MCYVISLPKANPAAAGRIYKSDPPPNPPPRAGDFGRFASKAPRVKSGSKINHLLLILFVLLSPGVGRIGCAESYTYTNSDRNVIHSYTKTKSYCQTDSKALTRMKWFLLFCHTLYLLIFTHIRFICIVRSRCIHCKSGDCHTLHTMSDNGVYTNARAE